MCFYIQKNENEILFFNKFVHTVRYGILFPIDSVLQCFKNGNSTVKASTTRESDKYITLVIRRSL